MKVVSSYLRARRSAFRVTVVIRQLVHADLGRLQHEKNGGGVFKVHCLAVMDEVQAKRESVLITKHGKPVAKLVPADKNIDDIYNFLAGKGAVTGDVVSPALSEEEWGELK